jgi:hypothetical protein
MKYVTPKDRKHNLLFAQMIFLNFFRLTPDVLHRLLRGALRYVQ